MPNKTQPTKASVTKFLAGIEDETRRRDAKALDKLFREITGTKPVMWGESLVGYGQYHYRYASGREGDFLRSGFSPRKQNTSLYLMLGCGNYEDLLGKLGPHKTGASCLYLKRLGDVDLTILKMLIAKSWKDMNKRYPA